jgi:polar amino acid transport system substrate-binding protein
MQSTSRFLGVFFVSLFLGAVAWADNKTLPIGATEWPPFEYAAPDGKPIGTDTEIIEQVVRRMGYVPEMRLQPWKRIEQSGVDGTLAAVYSIIKTAEREKSFYYTDAINRSKHAFFKRKDDRIDWKEFSDLKAKRMALSAGYAYPKIFEEAVKQKVFRTVVETFGDNPELTNLRQLQQGGADLFVCEISVCQHLIKTHADELKNVDYISRTIDSGVPVHAGFSKKWPGSEQLVKRFNAELKRFIAEGERNRIFKKYGIAAEQK